MAREIVITSVPRGVRPGRTGFQIAMRTAGLREDICDQLEPLGVYRHLPPGTGPNPECYFHKIVQTNVGPLQVLGRVVDAGADYSSRSNKLAHLVAIDQAELNQLRQSSPAAVLRSIDGRLARTWPGGPEERPQPLSLGGAPAVSARICTGWQQAIGDAGWGGVLAELAVKNRSALVIAPDSSPHWCRQLLALFEEALSLVPANRRWNVTFDTTVLSQAAVTWRGTYAGSPESGQRSGNVLVIDLSGRPTVPADYAGSPLVDQARRGAPVIVPSGPAPVGPKPPPVGDDWNFPPVAPAVPIGGNQIPPPPPVRSGRTPGHVYDDPKTNHWQVWVAAAGLLAILLLIGLVGVVYMLDVPGMMAKRQARNAINAWAEQHDGQPPGRKEQPVVQTWLTAYGEAKGGGDKPLGGLERARLESVLPLMNQSLLTEKVTPETISDLNAINTLVNRIEQLRAGSIDEAGLVDLGLLLPEPAGARPALVGWVNEMIKLRPAPEGVANEQAKSEPMTLQLVQGWIDTLQPLAVLTQENRGDAGSGASAPAGIEPAQIKPALDLLLRLDQGSIDGHIAQLRANPQLLVGVKSCDELRQRLAPPKEKTDAPPRPTPEELAAQKKAEEDRKKAEQVAKQDQERMAREQAEAAAWKAFVNRVDNTTAKDRSWPDEDGGERVLIDQIPENTKDIDWKKVQMVLGAQGDWSPRAEIEKGSEVPAWRLLGLPGEKDKHWGTIRLEADDDTGKRRLMFTRQKDAPWICGYVPIVFVGQPADGKQAAEKTAPLQVATVPHRLYWSVTGDATWADLAGMPAQAETGDSAKMATPPDDEKPAGDSKEATKPKQEPRQAILTVEPKEHAERLRRCQPRLEIAEPTPPGRSLELRLRTDPATSKQNPAKDVVVEAVFKSTSGVLVERFTRSVDLKSLSVTLVPEDQKPWSQRYGTGMKVKYQEKVSPGNWVEMVHQIVQLTMPETQPKPLALVELKKRIGIDPVHDLTTAQRQLDGKIKDKTEKEDQIKKAQSEQDKQKLRVLSDKLGKEIDRLRIGIDKNKVEIEHYAAWSASEKASPLEEWKRHAIQYVTQDGRHFQQNFDKDHQAGADEAAGDPAIVQDFLAREADWRRKVEATFTQNDISKAKQNELIALLVLAHLDKFVVWQMKEEDVRQAFSASIPESLTATITMQWTIEGQSDMSRTTVAKVQGVR
jgi:hypothetical protein